MLISFLNHTFTNVISLKDGAVNSCNSYIDFGMGVRVLAGDQTGYAYVENVTLDDMLNAARTAARIASGKKKYGPVRLAEKTLKKNYYPITTLGRDQI